MLTAGLLLGLLGMHGLAPGHPVAHAVDVTVLPAATASNAPMAEGHGTSTPVHHHDPAVHHDICKAVTGGSALAGLATAPAQPPPGQTQPAPPRSARGASLDHHPPDILEQGVLRI